MRSLYLFLAVLATAGLQAQLVFPFEIDAPEDFTPTRVEMPGSPLRLQVLFIGGTDMVQTTATYGNEAGQTHAKEWHDFIGFTPDETGNSLGWVSVNHESIYRDDRIGDGGGMTTFRVERDPINGELIVMDQTLEDGRSGKFFNVDFANTVGETGMNCGGISSIVDGRIWTAEEWFRSSNSSINNGRFSNNNENGAGPYGIGYNPDGSSNTANQGVRDLRPFTVDAPEFPFMDGETIEKYENFNWMVEIDPRQAKAIRKQYNFGRQGFEGGAVSPDNRYIYLGVDATPGFWVRFEADTPGDFTQGRIQVYKHDGDEKWITIDQTKANMLDFTVQAVAAGATMYNRNEWVAVDPESGIIYWTETGRDAPAGSWNDELEAGAVLAPHHIELAAEQTARVQEMFPDSVITADGPGYRDYYGRVLAYNPETEEVSVVINGGPYFEESPTQDEYPDKHLSNPDGLNVMMIDGKPFLVICEDLNGETFGRMPFENTSDGAGAGLGIRHRMCEMFLLDLSIENATVNDLVRLTVTPLGAEITGAMPTPDGKSLLVNSQHPSGANPFPFNHSLTFAIHGFDDLTVSGLAEPEITNVEEFSIYPNPTLQEVYFNRTQDVALYNTQGQRLRVYRNVRMIDVSQLAAGVYYLRSAEGQIVELVKQ